MMSSWSAGTCVGSEQQEGLGGFNDKEGTASHLGQAGEAVALQHLGAAGGQPGGQGGRPRQRQHLPDAAGARAPRLLHGHKTQRITK